MPAKGLPALGRELLGVVEAKNLWVVGKRDGTHRERPCNGAAAHLVHADERCPRTHLAHERVHAVDAVALSGRPLDALACGGYCMLDLLSGVLGVPLHEDERLVLGASESAAAISLALVGLVAISSSKEKPPRRAALAKPCARLALLGGCGRPCRRARGCSRA